MSLQGKGFFIFRLSQCEEGNPAAILAGAQAAGLSHVLVKIADGPRPFGIDPSGKDYTLPVVRALRGSGIAVWGWHYVYGVDPAGEAAVAVRRLRELGLDGYVVDAEDEYAQPGKDAAARRFMGQVRSDLSMPIALSSYRFPNYHPELPWAAFLDKCDYQMPQVYWEAAHNPGQQLRESKRQCDALPNARPYLATGAAYGTQGGWASTSSDLLDFLDTARLLGIQAVNFFSWDYCRTNRPDLWTTVAGFGWPAPPQVPTSSEGTADVPVVGPAPDDFSLQYLEALNSRQPARVAALYAADAIRVRVDQVYDSPVAIQEDYDNFFASLPEGAIFVLTRSDVQGAVHNLKWQVGVMTGLSTLVVEHGKIRLEHARCLLPPLE